MPPTNQNSPLSTHGSAMVDGAFRIYHQGGLDTYCGFYAILNLVNFLQFKTDQNIDFIGSHDDGGVPFGPVRKIAATRAWRDAFPRTPLGGEGLDTIAPRGTNPPKDSPFVAALRAALKTFGLKHQPKLADDQKADPEGERQDRWFRYGVEKPFGSPSDVLGIAAIYEGESDVWGQWIVLIGKAHLKNVVLSCSPNWDGIVLDSERGYECWRVRDGGSGPQLELRRAKRAHARKIEWVYSFVSVVAN
jgi:hypothetical protein